MMPVIRILAILTVWCALSPWAFGKTSVDDGIAAFKAGRFTTALDYLESSDTSDLRGQAFLGLTQAALGNCSSALGRLLNVNDGDRDLYRLARIAAAKCYSAAGKESQSIIELDSLERRFPDDPDVLYLLAKTHMKAFNDATYTMFQRTPGSYRVHELSAEIFEVENRYSDAAAEYRKAIEINPGAPDLHFRLGRALLLESHDAQALENAAGAFKQELEISPEDSACEFQLGQIAQVQGHRDEARRRFERALALSPSFVQALLVLGKLDTQDKLWDRAIARLTRAATLQPDNEAVHYALLTAYRDSGRIEQAQAERTTLEHLQKPPEGEFSDFLKKLGGNSPKQ